MVDLRARLSFQRRGIPERPVRKGNPLDALRRRGKPVLERDPVPGCRQFDNDIIAATPHQKLRSKDLRSELQHVQGIRIVGFHDRVRAGTLTENVRIVARPAKEDIVAGPAVDLVISCIAVQRVVTAKAAKGIGKRGSVDAFRRIGPVDAKAAREQLFVSQSRPVGKHEPIRVAHKERILGIERLEVNRISRVADPHQERADPERKRIGRNPASEHHRVRPAGSRRIQHRIDAVAQVEYIGVGARSAKQKIVARAAYEGVVAAPAADDVAAGPARNRIICDGSGQHVCARSAGNRRGIDLGE